VVYLIGAVVTPVAGRAIDRIGHRFTLVAAFLGGVGGICLTLVPHLPAVLLGLALTSTGVFIAQSAASSYVGRLAEGARGAAVGLYVMFYYTGGSFGAALPGTFWNAVDGQPRWLSSPPSRSSPSRSAYCFGSPQQGWSTNPTPPAGGIEHELISSHG